MKYIYLDPETGASSFIDEDEIADLYSDSYLRVVVTSEDVTCFGIDVCGASNRRFLLTEECLVRDELLSAGDFSDWRSGLLTFDSVEAATAARTNLERFVSDLSGEMRQMAIVDLDEIHYVIRDHRDTLVEALFTCVIDA